MDKGIRADKAVIQEMLKVQSKAYQRANDDPERNARRCYQLALIVRWFHTIYIFKHCRIRSSYEYDSEE